jgi:hypothetical protein
MYREMCLVSIKNGQVLKGDVSPKKADYVRSFPSKPILSTLKLLNSITRNSQNTHHIILRTLFHVSSKNHTHGRPLTFSHNEEEIQC